MFSPPYHKFSELTESLCGGKARDRKQAISRPILAARIVFSARFLAHLFIELMGRDTRLEILNEKEGKGNYESGPN
jgi:hypothetical protein